MRLSDLLKATIVCGMIAYLVFIFPVLSQILTITFLTLLWLTYFYHTIRNLHSH